MWELGQPYCLCNGVQAMGKMAAKRETTVGDGISTFVGVKCKLYIANIHSGLDCNQLLFMFVFI